MTRGPRLRGLPSLRDRKRERTRRDLAHAAYTIVRDGGVDAVTAEAVADRAGVSRRTFFNYFPSVESVLTASVTEFFASVSEPPRRAPRGRARAGRASLAVVDDPTDLDLVERIGVLAAAGEASPHAKALILGELHAWLDWFEELAARAASAPSRPSCTSRRSPAPRSVPPRPPCASGPGTPSTARPPPHVELPRRLRRGARLPRHRPPARHRRRRPAT